MSNFPRGEVDGVMHYCDPGWADMKTPGGKRRVRLWFPWCMLGRKKDIVPIEQRAAQKAMVTCLQCMYIRRKR